MRRAPPSRALVRYLDEELASSAPTPVRPTALPAPVPPVATSLGGPSRARLVAAIVALSVALSPCFASWAFGQRRDAPIVPTDTARSTPVGECVLAEPTETMCAPMAYSDDSTRAGGDQISSPAGVASEWIGAAPVGARAPAWFAPVVAVAALALGALVALTLRRRRRRVEATRPQSSRVALVSRRGGRKRNEDFGVTLDLDGAQAVIVADGLGGHIGGARASRLAVRAAERLLREQLEPRTELGGREATTLVEACFAAAAEVLRDEDDELGLADRGHDALRTTLVVAVALGDHYVMGAIGDGAALLRRKDGTITPLMHPQRAGAQNVLAASLGPVADGEPMIRIAPRHAGDLLVVATDGVSDRVDDAFWHGVAAFACESSCLRRALEDVLDQFERVAEPSDNITLGAIAPPTVDEP